MSQEVMYPQIKEEVKQQGAKNVLVLSTVLRKEYNGVYYLIPVQSLRPITIPKNFQENRYEALQDMHESAVQHLNIVSIERYRDAQGNLIISPDVNQCSEEERLCNYFGVQYVQPEPVVEETKEVYPKLRPVTTPKTKRYVKTGSNKQKTLRDEKPEVPLSEEKTSE